MNAPMMPMELNEAICKQKPGKAPGPDGITAESYHKFTLNISGTLKKIS